MAFDFFMDILLSAEDSCPKPIPALVRFGSEPQGTNEASSKKSKKKRKNKSDLVAPAPVQEEAKEGTSLSTEKINQMIEEKLVLKGSENERLIEIPSEFIENFEVPYFAHGKHILYQPRKRKTDFSSHDLSLERLVDCFFEPEPLFSFHNTSYKCEKCQMPHCIRKYWLFDLPPVLTFAIKRFHHTTNGNFRKIDDHVSIPEALDLFEHTLQRGSNFDSPEEVLERHSMDYRLYGIVEHIGTMERGHYQAYVKHQSTWFLANDSSMKKVTFEEVKKAKAYLVFYKRNEKK